MRSYLYADNFHLHSDAPAVEITKPPLIAQSGSKADVTDVLNEALGPKDQMRYNKSSFSTIS